MKNRKTTERRPKHNHHNNTKCTHTHIHKTSNPVRKCCVIFQNLIVLRTNIFAPFHTRVLQTENALNGDWSGFSILRVRGWSKRWRRRREIAPNGIGKKAVEARTHTHSHTQKLLLLSQNSVWRFYYLTFGLGEVDGSFSPRVNTLRRQLVNKIYVHINTYPNNTHRHEHTHTHTQCEIGERFASSVFHFSHVSLFVTRTCVLVSERAGEQACGVVYAFENPHSAQRKRKTEEKCIMGFLVPRVRHRTDYIM